MTITIGSQTNVPSAGSAIVSPWAQDTARKIVHKFNNNADRDGWTAPPNGSMAVTLDTNTLWQYRGTTWTAIDSRPAADARYDAKYLPLTGGTVDAGDLIVGNDPNTGRGVKITAGTGADLRGRVAITAGPAGAGVGCLTVARSNGVTGMHLVQLMTGTQTTIIGSISIASASSVAYNTTSDPRLKTRDGELPADTAATQAAELGHAVYVGRYNDPDTGAPTGEQWVLLNSTDIEPLAPYAVTGDADAVDDDGKILGQQVNFPALVPLLFAALANALDRIDALEAVAS